MASDSPRPEPTSGTPGQGAGGGNTGAPPTSAGRRPGREPTADTSNPSQQAAGTADSGAATARGWLQRLTPAPQSGPPRPKRLDLGDAIHDGWQAFCRAPRVFAAFALLVNLLIVLQQPLLLPIGSAARPSSDPRDWALYGLGLMVTAAVILWGCLGLARGSLLALGGQRPTLVQLLRWDGPGWRRLLRAWLRLLAMVGLPGGLSLVLFGLPLLVAFEDRALEQEVVRALGRETTFLLALLLLALLLVCLALTLVALLYLTVNQVFLLQIVLLEERGGADAVERGRQLVDPQWPLVLLLVIVCAILNGLGLLACWIGSLAAWPAVTCITTAAYQQLRRSEQPSQAAEAATGAGEPETSAP